MHYVPHIKQTSPAIKPTLNSTQIRSAINTLMALGTFLLSDMAHAEQSQTSEPALISQTLFSSTQFAIQNLLNYAITYQGAAYRRGGSNPETGFDCSGFVRYVFDNAEGITLPHSSNGISHVGDPVTLDELKPGDLVFFYLLQKTVSHVGIYLGNSQFIHSSSSRNGSVVISSLNENYWAKHYFSARRVGTTNKQSRINLATNQPVPVLQLENRLHEFAND
jgi:cell wall-associated NlpC family hydrolase